MFENFFSTTNRILPIEFDLAVPHTLEAIGPMALVVVFVCGSIGRMFFCTLGFKKDSLIYSISLVDKVKKVISLNICV